ncbi:DUF1501 domain-containing protein [Phenylobacterium sp.]|jgi:uncharacterized protein (DUF1501 family)|uniref:DUF1501 domain-containing protein n=1 Tax=Phenylobacterium sp. TaxID=1871053 RepID=UPI0037CB340F
MTRYSPATRRHLLKMMAAAAPLGVAAPFALQMATLGSAAAQTVPTSYKALVCIFLFGGNDSHNMVLATDSDSWGRYFAARNTGNDPIALMPPGTAPAAVGSVSPVTARTVTRSTPEFLGGVLPITPRTPNPVPAGTNASSRSFALHPALSPLVQGAASPWSAGRLAILANVGPLIVPTTKAQYSTRSVSLPPNLMSHNDQVSIWQSGAAEGAKRGWGGLMADSMLAQNGSSAVFTAVSANGNAVFLAGNTAVQYQINTSAQPAILPNAASGSTLYGSQTAARTLAESIRDVSGTSLFAQDHAGMTRRAMDSAQALNTAFASGPAASISAPSNYTNPVTGAVEANSLATQLMTVARSVAAATALGVTRQVFFVGLGGFDTHDNQNTTHTNLMGKLAHAMAYFDGVLGNIGGLNMRGSVTTFTMSDFGRTFTSNGDGTDHAWGGHQLIMGGAVRGRDVFGQFPTVGVDRAGFSNPDMSGNILIPTTSVYQVGSTLGKWFGLADAQLLTIFPNLGSFSRRDLGFMV